MKSLKYIIAGFCLAALPGMEAWHKRWSKWTTPGRTILTKRLCTKTTHGGASE